MIDLVRSWAVIVCESFGWLSIVEKGIVLDYLDSRKRATRSGKNLENTPSGVYLQTTTEKVATDPRIGRVLAALLISMTTGAIVLLALSGRDCVGPWCFLWRVDDPIKKALQGDVQQTADRWNGIEVFYSNTRRGNIEYLARLDGVKAKESINCHFVVCNGFGGRNGQIQTTRRWKAQQSAVKSKTWNGGAMTIRICVVASLNGPEPTSLQRIRVGGLIEELCRRFEIEGKSVYYPENWKE